MFFSGSAIQYFVSFLPLVFVSFRVRSVLVDRGVAQASRLGGD
jgi:hypothetical protein